MLQLPTLPGVVESPSHFCAAKLACAMNALDEQKVPLVQQKAKCEDTLMRLMSSFDDEAVLSEYHHEKDLEAPVSEDPLLADSTVRRSSIRSCAAHYGHVIRTLDERNAVLIQQNSKCKEDVMSLLSGFDNAAVSPWCEKGKQMDVASLSVDPYLAHTSFLRSSDCCSAAQFGHVIRTLDEQNAVLLLRNSKCKEDVMSLLSSFDDAPLVFDYQDEKDIDVVSVSMDTHSVDCIALESPSCATTAETGHEINTLEDQSSDLEQQTLQCKEDLVTSAKAHELLSRFGDSVSMPACQYKRQIHVAATSPDSHCGVYAASNSCSYLCAEKTASIIKALDEDNLSLVRQKAKREEDLTSLLSNLDDLANVPACGHKKETEVHEVHASRQASSCETAFSSGTHARWNPQGSPKLSKNRCTNTQSDEYRQAPMKQVGTSQPWPRRPVFTDLTNMANARPCSKSSSSFVMPGSVEDVQDVSCQIACSSSGACSTAQTTPRPSSATVPTSTTSSGSDSGSDVQHVILNVYSSPGGSRTTSASSQRARTSTAVSAVSKSFRGAAAKVKQLLDFGRWHAPSRQQGSCNLDVWALHYAARDGDVIAVRHHLSVKADPCTVDKNGITALHLASEGGHDEIVQVLLENGVSPHACTYGCQRSASGITALHAAALAGNSGVVKLLLEAHAAPSQARGDGVTALHFSVQGGHADIVNLLLEGTADANATGAGGFTSLHDAALAGLEYIVHALLMARADPNAVTEDGTTPLHGSARCGHVGITQDLLASGASCLARSAGGFSPLHDAAHAGHMGIVLQLLEAGAAPKDKSDNGSTPIQLAAHAGHKDVAAAMARKHVQLMRALRQS